MKETGWIILLGFTLYIMLRLGFKKHLKEEVDPAGTCLLSLILATGIVFALA